ncbi:hypothetical protein CHH80_16870 [Bacillus sp. 7504-2]|nr:hypothetical protein CHH80_16870 [Bacillus sp. 7504-2]
MKNRNILGLYVELFSYIIFICFRTIAYCKKEYLNHNHPNDLGSILIEIESGNEEFRIAAIPAAAGVYFIQDIGQIALTAAGALAIGEAIIAAGSWFV